MQKTGKMLTKNGNLLNPIAMGTWSMGFTWSNQDRDEALESLLYAFSQGINVIDTAPAYGKGESEKFLSSFISKINREDLFLATKCSIVWSPNGKVKQDISAVSIKNEVKQSLERLQTNYIDLYQIHWPYDGMPLEEAMVALKELKEAGIIRYIGLCNMSLVDLKRAEKVVNVDSFQGLFNLIERNQDRYYSRILAYRTESEILPYCEENDKTFLAYCPLMQGLLGGKFKGEFNGQDDRMGSINFKDKELLAKNLIVVEKLKEFATAKGCTVSQLSLAYILNLNQAKLVLCGLRKKSYVEDALAAIKVILTTNEMEQLRVLATRDL